ncbi:hypothetical protein [uncultured Bacteroides sp.]|uniref:hypothetical protein n=1 Tax=uncultured Bacteroides sp. TaxID=162156 RepID=UPI002611D020|nr:hypothetical protein [uncultured Bacteroides sp.]
MKKFIYPFTMIIGLIIASSCTESEEIRGTGLRTRSISTAASASNAANRPTPDTRMAYEDYNEEGMFLSWQSTDAFKGFYTTSHVQEVVGQETSALFTYSGASATGDDARARFTGNVAEDVDANTSFNLFYPAARSTGNTWAEAQASLTGQVQKDNNSTAHLSAYNYMRATDVTGIETSLVPFEHLLSIMRFDLTLEGYDPITDGEPYLFLLRYEGEEKSFYETLSASTATGITDSRTRNLSLGLEDIEISSQGTEALPANVLRVYFMMIPTTLPAGNLTVTVVCRSDKSEESGTRYVKTQTLSSDVTYEAGKRYRAMDFKLVKRDDEADGIIEYDDPHAVTPTEYKGSGTEADPYIIESTANLQQLITDVNGGYDSYAGKYFRLTKDILITVDEWTPIGGHNNKTGADGEFFNFKGHLDGDGHIIKGFMKCQSFTAAFIGAASEGSIKNLHILADVENCPINTAQAARTAGLIAYLSGTTPYSISNCSYNGRITSTGGGNHVAGLVGSTFSALTINGCINRGTISATNNAASSSTQNYIGGIIGSAQSDVTISQCSNYGTFHIGNAVSSSSGGIIGYSSSSANLDCRYCDNHADIHSGSGCTYVGGICGQLSGNASLHACHNHASLSVNTGTETTMRGIIVGQAGSGASVKDCCVDDGGNGSLPLIGSGTASSSCDENHGK